MNRERASDPIDSTTGVARSMPTSALAAGPVGWVQRTERSKTTLPIVPVNANGDLARYEGETGSPLSLPMSMPA